MHLSKIVGLVFAIFISHIFADTFQNSGPAVYVRVPQNTGGASGPETPSMALSAFEEVPDFGEGDLNLIGGIQYFPSNKNITLGMTPAAQEHRACIERCHMATDGNCTLPDWLNLVSVGVDITRADFVPIRTTNGIHGLKRNLFNFDCNSGNMFSYGEDLYDMPDEITYVRKAPNEAYDLSSNLMDSLSTINSAKKYRFSLDPAVLYKSPFSLTGSHSEHHFRETLAKTDSVIVNAEYPVSNLEVNVKQELFFDTATNSLVKNYITRKLSGKTYAEKAREYQNFVVQWGTHAIKSATFGGMLRFITTVGADYHKVNSESNILNQASVSNKLFLSAKGAHVNNVGQETEAFTENSAKSITCFGGTLTDITSPTWTISGWQESVEENPHLLGARLTPISDFVLDESAKEGVKTATCRHIALVALDDILEEITFRMDKIPDNSQASVAKPLSDLRDVTNAYKTRLRNIRRASQHNYYCHRVLDAFSKEAQAILESISNGVDRIVQAPGLPNDFGGPVDTQCPDGYLIDSIKTEWSKMESDRKWKATCRKSLFKLSSHCYTYGPFRKHSSFSFTCPNNGVIVGLRSMHDDQSEDRIWSYTCCPLATESCNTLDLMCSWSVPTYVKQAKTQLDIPWGNFVRSVRSFTHMWKKTSGYWRTARRNYYCDRVWEYEYCYVKSC